MKTYVKESYKDGDFVCYSVMEFDEKTEESDHVGTFMVREGVAPIHIIDAVMAHFKLYAIMHKK